MLAKLYSRIFADVIVYILSHKREKIWVEKASCQIQIDSKKLKSLWNQGSGETFSCPGVIKLSKTVKFQSSKSTNNPIHSLQNHRHTSV